MKISSKNSFTLIELLITISIFAIVILALYSGFNTGLFSYRRIEASLSTYQTARKVFNRIDLDLRNSFAYSNDESKFSGNEKEISFLTLIGTSFSSISYRFEEDSLTRLCKKYLESLKEDSFLKPKVIAKKIKELSFSYAYPTSDERIYDWKEDWGEEEKNKLPLAVKIKLILKEKLPKGIRDVEFKKVVFLPR